MEQRLAKLEGQVNSLNGNAIEHRTIVHSLDKSMQSIAKTMEDMGKVMAANEVREESHQSFKIEVINKLNLATERRDADRDINRKFHSNSDKRISLMEQSNKGLSVWKTTGLTLIVSTTMVLLSALIKSGTV